GPGDEVITTPMTFCASVNVIEHVGARPVLVDVEPDTLNIDPERIAAAITPRTRAILPVHYAGHPVELDVITTLAGVRGLAVVQGRRREVVARYTAAFGADPALEPPVVRPDVEHAWHLYVLRLRLDALRIGRDRFIEELTARNIGTSVHFIPVHLHPYYRDKYGYAPDAFPIAHDNYRRLLSLPLHPGLSDRDVADVIAAVLDVARTYRR